MLMTREVKWRRYKVFIVPFLKLSQKLKISQNKKPNDKKEVFLSSARLVIYPPPNTSNHGKLTKPSKMTKAIITIIRPKENSLALPPLGHRLALVWHKEDFPSFNSSSDTWVWFCCVYWCLSGMKHFLSLHSLPYDTVSGAPVVLVGYGCSPCSLTCYPG